MRELVARVNTDRRWFWAIIVTVLLVGLWFRIAFVSTGLPYFYGEDEAHHFNRVVRMTQRGEFNPNYFHKPSLHFYLRMPVVAASFLWSVKKGELRSLQEIKTEDPYGLAKYNFTASHPRIVKWSRALSVLLALGLVAGAMKISWLLIPSWPLAIGVGLLTAVSPALVGESAIIGVDMPMAFFSLLAVIFSLDFYKTRLFKYLVAAAVFSGLATSSKYNALPIVFVPMLSIFVARAVNWKNFYTALLLPVLSFFAASPFILVSLPLFLDQFAYEIWHYGVQGHSGQMGTPGIAQLLFYMNWIMNDSIGVLGLIFAVIGALYFVLRLEREAIVAFSFPALLMLLMCLQKTNFTRNLLAVLPFISVLAVFGLYAVLDMLKRFVSEQRMPIVSVVIFILLFIQPLLSSLERRSNASTSSDTRDAAFSWLHDSNRINRELAISGQLQFPRFSKTFNGKAMLSRLGVERIDENEPLVELWLNGFDEVALSASRKLADYESNFLYKEKEFAGADKLSRVVKNPAIFVYSFNDNAFTEALKWISSSKAVFEVSAATVSCNEQLPEEENCWIKRRLEKFSVDKAGSYSLNFMTPWHGQELKIWSGDKLLETISFKSEDIGKWVSSQVSFPSAGEYTLQAKLVKSPFTQELNQDTRRLAVAIR